MTQLGQALASAIADKDATALRALLTPDVDFKGLTPGSYWEAHSPEEVAEIWFGSWLEPHDHVESVVSVETGQVGDRKSLTYRLRIRNDDGTHEVEQQVYFETAGERVSYVRVLCSGFMPV